ncbi:hypothetical protein DFA_08440 [Cavenderia fasciculata]|uniref:Uncharacterized protein n=1 Tax=Cavenderia fasciculata TaxID=261658 RepID=F4Q671_CACFS|nr:uncharacterized protein DFA_08440 [Cavenderia fasciculata]EGG17445.1 hypothetical protein DFA_08440 [Cavenderia fasciculata]|eukprot:XP_004355929.1 hypothetical protein DFA_08440 [Cavenderia fasciculata]
MSMEKLSNLILSQIITDIGDNVDIICLLLTCKKLYHNSGLRRLVKFKGIEVITDTGYESKQFKATATQFKLNSFKDILKNRILDQHVICLPDHHNDLYPQWIQDIIYDMNRADQSNIKTAMVKNSQTTSKRLESLYSIPSIETLFIEEKDKDVTVDLNIPLLPRLQHLSVRAQKLNICQDQAINTTLKSLKLDVATKYTLSELQLTKFVSLTELTFNSYFVTNIGPGLFPSSLTSLTLRPTEIPPRDTFLSLVYLDIHLSKDEIKAKVQDQRFIDLESLSKLKTLVITDDNFLDQDRKYCITFSVPPSIKVLTIWSECVEIPSQCSMPLLEELSVQQKTLIDGRISLLLCTSIKDLLIYECAEIIPANIIPPTLEKLSIYKYIDEDILGQDVLPPSLTHLYINGKYESVNIPQTLIKLKQAFNNDPLPQHLKKLAWESSGSDSQLQKNVLSSSYPTSLESLNLIEIDWRCTIDNIPPVKKLSLLLPLPKENWIADIPIYSITSRISVSQQQWLSSNTTHLTCRLSTHLSKGAFRLDEIINHTNVRYLRLIISTSVTTYQFSIQRLDADNNNVLVLETNTLTGGIITQRKSINNTQQQQQQQYDPLYLYYDIGSPRSTSRDEYQLKWTFDPSNKLK